MRPLGVDRYRHIVFLTGAGVSVASGLRPYRGPGGDAGTVAADEPASGDQVRAHVAALDELGAADDLGAVTPIAVTRCAPTLPRSTSWGR